MTVPDFQTFLLPTLRALSDGNECFWRDIAQDVASALGMTEDDWREMLPSGKRSRILDRVGWSKTYLAQAKLIETPRRGYMKISKRGLEALRSKPSRIDRKFLDQYPEFREFRERARAAESSEAENAGEAGSEVEVSPLEQVDSGYRRLRTALARELLDLVREMPPVSFEQLIVELMLKMGYGGSREDAGEAIGGSGDEGVDGLINEDRLGLDVIYLQAKRWKDPVGRPTVQQFAGSLIGKRAKKGVIMTTSTFTKEARAYAHGIEHRITLIDGVQLAELMIDFGIGVVPVETYIIKRVDSDYFDGE